jgi:hypothetical protein
MGYSADKGSKRMKPKEEGKIKKVKEMPYGGYAQRGNDYLKLDDEICRSDEKKIKSMWKK